MAPPKRSFREAAEAQKQKVKEATVAFDIDSFAGQTGKTLSVQVDNYIVNYQLLSCLEHKQMKKDLNAKGIFDLEEIGLHIIVEMMHRADGKTTVEKLNAMPAGLGNKIQNAVTEASGFL